MTSNLGRPNDVCVCGDYRRQHDSSGKCRICGDGTAEYDGCQKFVSALPDDASPEWHQALKINLDAIEDSICAAEQRGFERARESFGSPRLRKLLREAFAQIVWIREYDNTVENWDKVRQMVAAGAPHDGDCTGVSHTCLVCQDKQVYQAADEYVEAFATAIRAISYAEEGARREEQFLTAPIDDAGYIKFKPAAPDKRQAAFEAMVKVLDFAGTWAQQVSEQPYYRVAKGIASAARGIAKSARAALALAAEAEMAREACIKMGWEWGRDEITPGKRRCVHCDEHDGDVWVIASDEWHRCPYCLDEELDAALERCAELDAKLKANLEDFDKVKARAHEVAEHARRIGEERDKAEERCAELERALAKIAAYNDAGANAHLALAGSYSAFDEPGSVQIAREALRRQQPGDAGEAMLPAPAPSPER